MQRTPQDKKISSFSSSRRILHRVSSRLTVQLWPVGAGQSHRYAKYTYATFIRDFRTCELLSRDFHPTIESRSWRIKSV